MCSMLKKLVFSLGLLCLTSAIWAITAGRNDTGKQLIGTWTGRWTVLTSESLKASHGQLNNEAVHGGTEIVTIEQARGGFCVIKEAQYRVDSGKYYTANVVTGDDPTNATASYSNPCMYHDGILEKATGSRGVWKCYLDKKNTNQMMCYYVRSSVNHQAVAKGIFHKT